MSGHELTDDELGQFESFPHPPSVAAVRTTNVWIIEWLSADEKRTGRDLHEWMEGRRAGWSIYCPCQTKAEVLASIARAEHLAKTVGMIPVLHLEAHGGDDGLFPSSEVDAEGLSWEELTVPLQSLNRATKCNLLVVVAACTGFAVIRALNKGPRAPAMAIVGPDAEILPGRLLEGTKEFYRSWMAGNLSLTDIVLSASRETGSTHFVLEPFATFCYEVMAENLIKSIRPDERSKRLERLRARFAAERELSDSKIEAQLARLPIVSPWEWQQEVWDHMFMIDVFPENRERFGVDWEEITRRVELMVG
ncbi:hypothetical protein [Janthinobacterium sp. BJB304]|uniref:hypothetical protein n=1 Tax=Janthinobacterium sp. BJB304 TaxID=1572871 RepID=UPI00117BB8CF|nr:hypothetical protein [Janthinobacterium sp. BJB304]